MSIPKNETRKIMYVSFDDTADTGQQRAGTRQSTREGLKAFGESRKF
jgi:hypothetical protein